MKKVRIKKETSDNDSKNRDDEETESLKINNRKKSIKNLQIIISKYKKIINIMGFFLISLIIALIILIRANISKGNTITKMKQIKAYIHDNFNYYNSPNQDKNSNIINKENKNNDINNNSVINNTINNNNLRNNDIINNNIINNNIIITSDSIWDFSKLNYETPKVKRKIYVMYTDFWPAFKLERFDVHKILQERYEVIISNNPDYLIFGQFGDKNKDIGKKFDCVKLFLTIDNKEIPFHNTDYAIGIRYIQKGDRYFRKPTETHQLTEIHSVYNVIQTKGIDIKNKKFCGWVVSNPNGHVRNKFFEKLSKYKKVDSGGRYKNNIGKQVIDKFQFLSDYKFSICFENSKFEGYISEKLSNAFEAGTIPIYYGDDTILELINNRAYIHVRDENDFDEKIELIKKIDQNATLYEEIIREKIVIDDSRYPRELQKYKNFIYHIIEQDKQKAKRFNRKEDNFLN